MIIKLEQSLPEQQQLSTLAKLGKRNAPQVIAMANTMQATEEKFEFRKTARHEVSDTKSETEWDQMGRFLCIYGVKKPGLFDKEKRTIRIFSLLGEQLLIIEKLNELSQFKFRPRPNNILSKKAMNTLKAEYRKKFGKLFKEEEKKDNSKQQDEVRARKIETTNEFINNFYLPLR